MANYWCVNFDDVQVLCKGLRDGLWAMQYQYSHDGYAFQGHRLQIGATTRNWKALMEIEAGDRLIAYLPGGMFYAVGQVIPRRDRERYRSAPINQDSVDRTVLERRHRFLKGVVDYFDAPMLYEDFTDDWRCDPTKSHRDLSGKGSPQPNLWQYNQRIDVNEWEHATETGVHVKGLSRAAPFPTYRRAVFAVPQAFFDGVLDKLMSAPRLTS